VSSNLKIVTVIGARPQFIKAAAVSRAFSEAGVEESLVHTGQHFDANMSEVFFDELGIPVPKVNLGIGGGGHGQNTGRMLEAIERVLVSEKPTMVLVYGDTDSTLAGALAAAKLLIPVAHVEAGLRSWNRRMPEEVNRVLTDHVSSLLFAPTATAVANLKREGIGSEMVCLAGDVMYDAALMYRDRARERSSILNALSLESGKYILATVHRAENTDSSERLAAIFSGLGTAPLRVVLPLHPRTRARLQANSTEIPKNVSIVDPVGYLDMVSLTANAAVVATDSGGLQKEAFFHEVPCVTIRTETEWVELVQSGWNRLVDPADGLRLAEALRNAVGSRGDRVSPYGAGNARGAIVERVVGLS